MPLTIVLPSRRNNGHENNDFAAFVETQIDRAAQKIIDSSNQRYDEHAHGKLSYLLSLRRVMSQSHRRGSRPTGRHQRCASSPEHHRAQQNLLVTDQIKYRRHCENRPKPVRVRSVLARAVDRKPAQSWLTGINSRLLILMCAGWVSIQKMVSAMSWGWIASAPA